MLHIGLQRGRDGQGQAQEGRCGETWALNPDG